MGCAAPRNHVERLHGTRECHRHVDECMIEVDPETVCHKCRPDHHQERKGQHLHRRMTFHKIAHRLGGCNKSNPPVGAILEGQESPRARRSPVRSMRERWLYRSDV